MIFGYEQRVINEFGLQEMREISVSVDSSTLRALGQFFVETAEELDAGVSSAHGISTCLKTCVTQRAATLLCWSHKAISLQSTH